MCCLFLALIFLGPRAALLIFWLIPQGRALVNLAFNTWIWPLLGLIFLPWTTFSWVLVYGINGIVGFDWIWVGLGFVADLASYAGSAYRRRDIPYYPTGAP